MTTRNWKKPKLTSRKAAGQKPGVTGRGAKNAAPRRAKPVRGLPDLTEFRASLKMVVTEGSSIEDLRAQDRY